MQDLTPKQFEFAYRRWLMKYRYVEADEAVSLFLSDRISALKNRGSLRRARKALFLSSRTVAEKLGVSQSAYTKFERQEVEGLVEIANLERAAEAMDCELIYMVRPKSRKSFSQVIWHCLLKPSLDHWWVRSRPCQMKASALAAIAAKKMDDPKFRATQGWSRFR